MTPIWTSALLDAPAPVAWDLLVDPARWPDWGPTVRSAVVDGDRLELGARGTVTTVGVLRLPFEITAFDDGRRWAWRVGGLAATDHIVEAVGPNRCRVAFGVPWPAAPYLAVCRLALRRLGALAAPPALSRSA